MAKLDECGKSDIQSLVKKKTITVTQAARSFAECVNRAHYQDVSFVLLKNGRPVARIEPEGEKRCTGRELAEVLAGMELPVDEARLWHEDLCAGRQTLKAPVDRWQ
jgi:antitoxin (DNA-binding transcriptional repressor) of toxin-antitoxin stability system